MRPFTFRKVLVVATAVPGLWTATGGRAGAAGVTTSTTAAGGSAACARVGDGQGTPVIVSLSEFRVDPSPTTAVAGTTTFKVLNDGHETHELVVVRGDQPDRLPVKDGMVDEDALPAGSFIGEIEDIRANSGCSGTFELPAGPYVLFCNIVEQEANGRLESHYEEGMRAAFTVTAPVAAPTRAPAATAGSPAEATATTAAGTPAPLPRTGPTRALLITAGSALLAGGLTFAAGQPRRRP